jgi:hypothetical protein
MFDRKPAFRYWFLPRLARVLTRCGELKPLSVTELRASAPAAIIMDSRLSLYLKTVDPRLMTYLVREYLPLETVVWVPAPNVRLDEQHPVFEWMVLRSGKYRVSISEDLARSPWFADPLGFARLEVINLEHGLDTGRKYAIRPSSLPVPNRDNDVRLVRNGRALAIGPDGTCLLERGDRIRADLETSAPRAVMFFPGPYPVFFWTPFPRIPFEASVENP